MARWSRTVGSVVLAACAAAAVVVAPPPAPAQEGDATVAAALVKSGKAALAKKSWDEAITLFDRALKECPSAIEAEYQKAVALERKGDRAGAVASYRRFVGLLKDKTGSSKAAAEEVALGPQAEKRIAALAAGETELARIEDQFDAQLVAFAKKHASRDSAIAVRALRIVLEARPDHAEALALLASLGVEADAPAETARPAGDAGPFASIGVKAWDDLIERHTFDAREMQYKAPGFVFNTEGGKVVSPSEHRDYGTRYAFEAEVHVIAEKERGWLVGLVFGEKQGDFRTAFLQRGQVVLTRGNLEKGPGSDIDDVPLKNLDLEKWHRLGVKVDGTKVEVWLDGQRLVDATETDRPSLEGEIGLFQQRCVVEWRLLRAGKIE